MLTEPDWTQRIAKRNRAWYMLIDYTRRMSWGDKDYGILQDMWDYIEYICRSHGVATFPTAYYYLLFQLCSKLKIKPSETYDINTRTAQRCPSKMFYICRILEILPHVEDPALFAFLSARLEWLKDKTKISKQEYEKTKEALSGIISKVSETDSSTESFGPGDSDPGSAGHQTDTD